ncbi:MAG: hypothetical protein RL238_2406 [Actinomycetota bacterium]
MNPTELALFSEKEQTLLVATEPARLALLDEDALGEALLLVRRARNKYSGLHRRQASATVSEVGRRAATQSQNLRTLRKAEIFEDALARVSRAYSAAAKAAAAQLKSERLALAKSATLSSPAAAPKAAKSTAKAGKSDGRTAAGRGVKPASATASPARRGSSKAQGARRQAKRDSR